MVSYFEFNKEGEIIMREMIKHKTVITWGWILISLFLVTTGCKTTGKVDDPPEEILGEPVLLIIDDITNLPGCRFKAYLRISQNGNPIDPNFPTDLHFGFGAGWVELPYSGGVNFTQEVVITIVITYASAFCPFSAGDEFTFTGKMTQKGSVFRINFSKFN